MLKFISSLLAKREGRSSEFKAHRVYALLVFFVVLTSGTTYVLYTKTQDLFRWSLDERLIALASVASTRFEPQKLDKIENAESIGSDAYKETVLKLQEIRNRTRKVRYAYILRKTDDSNTLEFVADADSLTPDVPKDLNGDGTINEDDELVHPGDPYDVSELPEFREQAFIEAYVDPELVQDQWGTFLSGHAPILEDQEKNRSAKYIIGLDLDVSEYQELKNLALVPFTLFIVFLLFALTALTIILKRMWQTQVRILAETDEAKNATINVVAHQMGTVSTRFRWYAEMLRDGGASKEECAEQVESGNAELRNIASMFLDAAHVYTKKFTVNPNPLDLNVFFKRLSDAASLGASQKKIRYTASIPSHLPTVLLDESRTYFSIENLLSNAIKYTPEEGIVTFSLTNKDGLLRIIVKDTGLGIPKKDNDKMFSQMYRASNVKNIDGNGLGLYIAKEAIVLQGGKIWYESDGVPGKGTTFFVELPLKPAADQNPDQKK